MQRNKETKTGSITVSPRIKRKINPFRATVTGLLNNTSKKDEDGECFYLISDIKDRNSVVAKSDLWIKEKYVANLELPLRVKFECELVSSYGETIAVKSVSNLRKLQK